MNSATQYNVMPPLDWLPGECSKSHPRRRRAREIRTRSNPPFFGKSALTHLQLMSTGLKIVYPWLDRDVVGVQVAVKNATRFLSRLRTERPLIQIVFC